MTLPEKFLEEAVILSQQEIVEGAFRMEVRAPQIAEKALPGQFVQVRVPKGAHILRRPLGVGLVDKMAGIVTLFYRVVGKGTKVFSTLMPGETLSLLGPLGHGFDLAAHHPLIVGGGMGLSPVLFYAASMLGRADVLMSGKNKAELFWREIYAPYVQHIFCTTDDGSFGTRGFPTVALPDILSEHTYDLIVVCGPEVMMCGIAKIAKQYNIPCEVSLEKRMGCGLGACLSCSVDTTKGRKKVCKDGPVFRAEEVFA